jgi:hypothetical protein
VEDKPALTFIAISPNQKQVVVGDGVYV